jgi:hypothetical protein
MVPLSGLPSELAGAATVANFSFPAVFFVTVRLTGLALLRLTVGIGFGRAVA